MRIELLTQPDGDVVAYEIIAGGRGGRFHLHSTGEIWYRHPDSPPLFANPDQASFREAARAWLAYCDTVVEQPTETAQFQCVEALRTRLEKQMAQLGRGNSFWAVILEQAESGNL